MKTIDEYVNGIFKEFDKNDEDTKILIEETKSHLYDEVEDLKKQGLSEEKSINKAIYNFGKEKAVINELKGTLNKQDKLSKIMFNIALVMFSISVVFKVLLYSYSVSGAYAKKLEAYRNDKEFSQNIINNIGGKLDNVEVIDDSLKAEITQILNEFNGRTENGLYHFSIEKNYDTLYEYSEEVSKEQSSCGYGGSTLSEKVGEEKGESWTINYNITDAQNFYDSNSFNELGKYYKRTSLVNTIKNYLFVLSLAIVCISFLYKINIKNKISNNNLAYLCLASVLVMGLAIIGLYNFEKITFILIAGLLMFSTVYNKKYFEN